MRGSLVKLFDIGGVITDWKKISVSTLSTPSAMPVLLSKLRIRLLMATMNCVGPAAPMVSGGKALSARVAAVSLTPVVCGLSTRGAAAAASGGQVATFGASGLGRTSWKLRVNFRRTGCGRAG